MNPRFSIIVPVYKTEQYLHQCVDSILGQRFTDFEVILVDDGSPDGSGAICDEYAAKDSRVKVIHKENGGPTSARTAGANRARGTYVLFLDSDDYYDLRLLAHLEDILKRYAPDAILFDGVTFDTPSPSSFATALPEGLYADNTLQKIHSSLILNDAHQGVISYGVSAKVFLREAYCEMQKTVPPSLYKGEDMAVSVPLLAKCRRVYVSHFCGYYYRCTPGSIMNTFREAEAQQIKILADYLREKMDAFYHSRIDVYVLQHLFDYLDRAMLGRSFAEYLHLAKTQIDPEFLPVLKRVKAHTDQPQRWVALFSVKHRMYTTLWLLRKIKPRKH